MSTRPEIPIADIRCKKCGYQWTPRVSKIIQCPACKSRTWFVPKHEEKSEEGA